MSEASEVLAELQATVGLAKADRRADAWRWLDDIDRLASRLETVMAADVQVAPLPPVQGHPWLVIGTPRFGFKALCSVCGWETGRYPDYEEATAAGRAHDRSPLLSTSDLVAAAIDKAEAEHEWVVLGDGIVGYRAACPCGWRSSDYAAYVSADSAGRIHRWRGAGDGAA